jgi:hypothetical protein
MAKTSRDPFSPPPSLAPMKKKGGGRKKAAGVSAKADAGTLKKTKKTTTSKQKKNHPPPELSDIDETLVSQRKPPPEGIMPSLVPHVRQNTVLSTRNALPQPPANVYITSGDGNDSLDSRDKRMLFESERGAPPAAACPHFDDEPLDHTSPHKYPPASFVAAAASAASPSNTLEDNNDGTFKDLVGEETSALDDLSYSSAEDD